MKGLELALGLRLLELYYSVSFMHIISFTLLMRYEPFPFEFDSFCWLDWTGVVSDG